MAVKIARFLIVLFVSAEMLIPTLLLLAFSPKSGSEVVGKSVANARRFVAVG